MCVCRVSGCAHAVLPCGIVGHASCRSRQAAKDSATPASNGGSHDLKGTEAADSEESKAAVGSKQGADEVGAAADSTDATAGGGQANKPLSRVIVRRESTPGGIGTKLLLNVAVFKDMVVEKVHEKAIKFSCIGEGGEVEVYLATVRSHSARAAHRWSNRTSPCVTVRGCAPTCRLDGVTKEPNCFAPSRRCARWWQVQQLGSDGLVQSACQARAIA